MKCIKRDSGLWPYREILNDTVLLKVHIAKRYPGTVIYSLFDSPSIDKSSSYSNSMCC
ncbi:hypothetical protein C8R27_11731 [Nitrosomonas ureae]|nr:hypothetical protein C8R27_11731 [Nitrosomonas ureae]